MDDITFAQKRCKRCNDIKPARTHHCSVCDKCVFMMDHHCPWINNCVGHENLRYFLLFVFYLWIALCYMLITFAAIRHHHVFKEQNELFTFLVVLDGVISLIMFAFTFWNWYLAFIGYSTIEFWTSTMQEEYTNKVKFEFGFKTISDNLYRTFGTYKILRVLSPSMRNTPFTGLEWAFLLNDEGFDQSGTKWLTDVEMSVTQS
jgi:DHHC palmitoyltransferase